MRMGKERAARLFFWVMLAVVAAVFANLGFTTTWAMDDYWYVSFWKDGLPGFLRLNREHYLTFNGRVLVHVFVQTILALGNWAIGLAFPILTLAIPFFAVRAEREKRVPFAAAAVFSSALVLALSRAFFVEAYNWVSAFGNYVLPTAMISLEIYLLDRLKSAEHVRGRTAALTGLWCLLCGATTEQSGLAALAVSICFVLWGPLRRRKLSMPLLACALLNLAGLATVFLSPATWRRAQDEMHGALLENLLDGLREEGDIFFDQSLTCLLVGLVFLALAGLSWRVLRQNRAACCWLAAGCAIPLMPLLRGEGHTLAMFLLLAAMGLAGLQLFFFTAHTGLGALFLCALASEGAILLTDSIDVRTVLPGLLCLFAAFGVMTGAAAEEFPLAQVGLCVLLLVPGGVRRGAEFPGYWHNHLIEQENRGYIEEFQTTHCLYYNMDYIDELCYTKMYYDTFFQKDYKNYAGLTDPDGKIYFFSADGYVLYAGGERASLPALYQDGVLYLPVRCLEEVGGKITWTRQSTSLDLGSIHAETMGLDAFLYLDQSGAVQQIPIVEVEKCAGSMFLPEWIYRDVFGLTVTVDEQARCVTLER